MIWAISYIVMRIWLKVCTEMIKWWTDDDDEDDDDDDDDDDGDDDYTVTNFRCYIAV